MDPNRQQVLQEMLAEVQQQRAELDRQIGALQALLGIDGGEPIGTPVTAGGTAGVTASGVMDVEVAVTPGEFFGMSGPKATHALLNKFGRARPLHTEEIFRAIRKGGVSIQSEGGLYRSLFRDRKFKNVGKSRWGLSEWYPESKSTKSEPEKEDDAEGLSVVKEAQESRAGTGTEG